MKVALHEEHLRVIREMTRLRDGMNELIIQSHRILTRLEESELAFGGRNARQVVPSTDPAPLPAPGGD